MSNVGQVHAGAADAAPVLAVVSLALVVIGGILMASYVPRRPPLGSRPRSPRSARRSSSPPHSAT